MSDGGIGITLGVGRAESTFGDGAAALTIADGEEVTTGNAG